MSPLALFYILLAGSPIFHNEWSTLNNVETPFESMLSTPYGLSTRSNWLLRKALKNTFSTRRSILGELTGDLYNTEYSPIFSTESLFRNVNVIRRIAEVNPIMIEKMLTRPESHRFISKVLRHVEPETLFLVERMINKNVPSYIREKISRRVVKSLIRSTVMPRRSIVSELYPVSESFYPTESTFSNIFESPIFSSLFGGEFESTSPIVKVLLEKLLRRSEVPEVVLSKLVRKFVKKSIRHNLYSSPIESLLKSTRRHSTKSIKPVLVSIQLEKVAELKSLIRHLTVESHLTTPSVWTVRRIVKVIRDIAHPERVLIKKAMKKSLRSNTPVWCNMCENVCESSSWMSTPYTKYSKICSICTEVCPTMTPFSFVARHKSMNKERLVKKLIKKALKTVRYSKKEEKLCRVCDKVCESSSSFVPTTHFEVEPFNTVSICSVCEKVCESSIFRSPIRSSVFGRRHHKNVEYKLLKKLVKSSLPVELLF